MRPRQSAIHSMAGYLSRYPETSDSKRLSSWHHRSDWWSSPDRRSAMSDSEPSGCLRVYGCTNNITGNRIGEVHFPYPVSNLFQLSPDGPMLGMSHLADAGPVFIGPGKAAVIGITQHHLGVKSLAYLKADTRSEFDLKLREEHAFSRGLQPQMWGSPYTPYRGTCVSVETDA